MKNKIHYVVEKQLDDIDGVGTTNGLKDITLYIIKDNVLEELLYLQDQLNEESTEDIITDFIEEFVVEYNMDNVKLIRL